MLISPVLALNRLLMLVRILFEVNSTRMQFASLNRFR